MRELKEVYGNKLTKHHNQLIDGEIRKMIELFANWLHVEGFTPKKCTDPLRGPRVFEKYGIEWHNFQLYFAFMDWYKNTYSCQEK